MELLILFSIGLLIAICVLPFVALAKANTAKRALDDLAARLSSLENEVRGFERDTVPIPESQAAVAATETVPPPVRIATRAPAVPEKESVPRQFPKDSSKQPFLKSQRRADRLLIGSNSWARNSSRGSAGSRFSS